MIYVESSDAATIEPVRCLVREHVIEDLGNRLFVSDSAFETLIHGSHEFNECVKFHVGEINESNGEFILDEEKTLKLNSGVDYRTHDTVEIEVSYDATSISDAALVADDFNVDELMPTEEEYAEIVSENLADAILAKGPFARSVIHNASRHLSLVKTMAFDSVLARSRYFDDIVVHSTLSLIENGDFEQVKILKKFIVNREDFEKEALEAFEKAKIDYANDFEEALEKAIDSFKVQYAIDHPYPTLESVRLVEKIDERLAVNEQAIRSAFEGARQEIREAMLTRFDTPQSDAIRAFMTMKDNFNDNLRESIRDDEALVKHQFSTPIEAIDDVSDIRIIDDVADEDIVSNEEVIFYQPSLSSLVENDDESVDIDESHDADVELEENIDPLEISDFDVKDYFVDPDDLEGLSDEELDVRLGDEDEIDWVEDNDPIQDGEDVDDSDDLIDESEVEFADTEGTEDVEDVVELEETEDEELEPEFEDDEDSVEESVPAKSVPVESSKSRNGKKIATIAGATAVFVGASAFAIGGYVYPGFMLNNEAPTEEQSQTIDFDKLPEDVKETQSHFKIGDRMEVVSDGKIIPITITRFVESGAIGKDSSGQEWRVSNSLLSDWVASHPERFSQK